MKKKIWFWFIITVFLSNVCLVAQNDRSIIFKTGYAGFKDINSGWTWGIEIGKQLDDKVVLGLGTSIFRRSVYNESAISDSSYESGIYESTVETEKESHRTIIPLVGTIDIDIGHHKSWPLKYKIGGGAGYQMLFGSSVDYQNQGTTDNRNYNGWIWFLKSGMEYNVSRTASFVGEVVYSSSMVSKTSEIQADLPTKDTVNLSGFGIRFGLCLNIH